MDKAVNNRLRIISKNYYYFFEDIVDGVVNILTPSKLC